MIVTLHRCENTILYGLAYERSLSWISAAHIARVSIASQLLRSPLCSGVESLTYACIHRVANLEQRCAVHPYHEAFLDTVRGTVSLDASEHDAASASPIG